MLPKPMQSNVAASFFTFGLWFVCVMGGCIGVVVLVGSVLVWGGDNHSSARAFACAADNHVQIRYKVRTKLGE